MELEYSKEMITDLKDHFEKSVLELETRIQKNKYKWKEDLEEQFQKSFVVVAKKQKENGKGKLRYISCSMLLTSILTETYSLGIHFYDETFYLDEANVFTEIFLSYILEVIEQNIQAIKVWFRNKQLPYRESDLLEIKKVLALNYSMIWVKVLKEELISCFQKARTEGVGLSQKIEVTFGSYLEKQTILLVWEVA